MSVLQQSCQFKAGVTKLFEERAALAEMHGGTAATNDNRRWRPNKQNSSPEIGVVYAGN